VHEEKSAPITVGSYPFPHPKLTEDFSMPRSIIAVTATALLLFLLLPAGYSAARTTAELNVNQKAVEGRLQLQYPLRGQTLETGYDGIYKEDEYRLLGAEIFMGDTLAEDLEFFLGFRGIYGEVTALPLDPNLSSLAFSAKANYTLLRDRLTFPLVLGVQLNLSPEPMSFDDTEKYWSFRANLDFNILRNSGITVGYRYRNADLEKKWLDKTYTEDSVFIGYKITF